MALTPIEQIKLLIGDLPVSAFYPLFTDIEYQQFLDMNSQDVYSAVKMAAITGSLIIAAYPTRERVGEVEVWNALSSNYLKALGYLITNPTQNIPNGLMPWAGGISKADMCTNNLNPDVVQSPLNSIHTCDDDNSCYALCDC